MDEHQRCQVCGKVLGILGDMTATERGIDVCYGFHVGMVHEPLAPANTLRNADGTPYQAGKSRHNGNLDERGDVTVDYSPKSKSGTYVRIFMIDDGAVLTPKQALSLLAWLEQERETLERLANS